MNRSALITGADGGIGQALCSMFHDAGWFVIASDRYQKTKAQSDAYVVMDLERLCRDKKYRVDTLESIKKQLPADGLDVLINNAAVQIVAPVEQLTAEDWSVTMDVNLISPFLLTQGFLSELENASGSVVNIASIHAQLTKPRFSAYSTSKSALVGLTRALAIELGGRVRVNAIAPAAISTPMLEAGFADDYESLKKLATCHPSGMIGTPEDVARAALYFAETKSMFLNGAILGIDGGIGSRLHDPE